MTTLQKIEEDLKFLADKNDSPLVKCAYSLALAVCEIHLKPSPTPLPATDEEIEKLFYDKVDSDGEQKTHKEYFIAGYKASHPTVGYSVEDKK